MKRYAIAIHAGAESMDPKEVSPEKEEQYKEGLRQALQAGYQVLESGGSALNAVEAAVKSMEDFPLFNAGRGASLDEQDNPTFDAAMMDGSTLQAGALCNTRFVKHLISWPVLLWRRAIMCRWRAGARKILREAKGLK